MDLDSSKVFLKNFMPGEVDHNPVKENYEYYSKNKTHGEKLIYGASSQGLLKATAKLRVVEIHDSKCVICGVKKESKDLEIHHIVPRSMGGNNDIMNVVPLCQICHCAIHKILQLNQKGLENFNKIIGMEGEII
jgi:5-methylcytosine-specific restriction endonuclease McrA